MIAFRARSDPPFSSRGQSAISTNPTQRGMSHVNGEPDQARCYAEATSYRVAVNPRPRTLVGLVDLGPCFRHSPGSLGEPRADFEAVAAKTGPIGIGHRRDRRSSGQRDRERRARKRGQRDDEVQGGGAERPGRRRASGTGRSRRGNLRSIRLECRRRSERRRRGRVGQHGRLGEEQFGGRGQENDVNAGGDDQDDHDGHDETAGSAAAKPKVTTGPVAAATTASGSGGTAGTPTTVRRAGDQFRQPQYRSHRHGIAGSSLLENRADAAVDPEFHLYRHSVRSASTGDRHPSSNGAKSSRPRSATRGGGGGGGGRRQGEAEKPGSTRILWIMEEGTPVKKGDVVCELDAAAFRDQRDAQRIKVLEAENFVKQARNSLKINTLELRAATPKAFTKKTSDN